MLVVVPAIVAGILSPISSVLSMLFFEPLSLPFAL